jgi:uncharacterized membrane protein SirB2
MNTWNKIFPVIRQVLLFFGGIAIMTYAAVTQGHDIPFLICGLVLVGIVPVDAFLTRLNGGKHAQSSPSSLPPTDSDPSS